MNWSVKCLQSLSNDSVRSRTSSNDILVVNATAAATEACQVCDEIGCWRHKSTYKWLMYRLEITWLEEYARSRAPTYQHTHTYACKHKRYLHLWCVYNSDAFFCLQSLIEKEKWNQNILFFWSKQNKEPKHIADNQTTPTTHKAKQRTTAEWETKSVCSLWIERRVTETEANEVEKRNESRHIKAFVAHQRASVCP